VSQIRRFAGQKGTMSRVPPGSLTPHRACACCQTACRGHGALRLVDVPWTAATTGQRQRSQAVSESCMRSISRRDRSAARPGHWPSFRQFAIRPAAMERSIPAQKFLPRPVSKTCGRHSSCDTPASATYARSKLRPGLSEASADSPPGRRRECSACREPANQTSRFGSVS